MQEKPFYVVISSLLFSPAKLASLQIPFMINNTKIAVGEISPDFLLPQVSGQNWSLKENLGRVVALLFYPGSETLVCTKQLCSVRDNWTKYIETGAEVIGVSPDSLIDNERFASRYNLPMPLLTDDNRIVTRMFGSHWWMPIWATRAVVVIDAKGIVRYRKVMVRVLRPSDDEVLAAIHLAKYDILAERRVWATVNKQVDDGKNPGGWDRKESP